MEDINNILNLTSVALLAFSAGMLCKAFVLDQTPDLVYVVEEE